MRPNFAAGNRLGHKKRGPAAHEDKLRARRGKGRMPSDVRNARSAPDQILCEFVETGTLLIKGRRRYGKIAQIASLPRDSILSHPKVYYPGQATGLKQILLGIAYGLR
jgi:hypothetical protein